VATVSKFTGTPYLWEESAAGKVLTVRACVYLQQNKRSGPARDADMQFEFIKTGVGSVEELKAGTSSFQLQ